jgi:signal transduction histidine kinase
MPTILTSVRINKEEDILSVHDLTMRIGNWARIPPVERIHFAAVIAQNSSADSSDQKEIIFSIEENENGQHVLKAVIRGNSDSKEKAIIQPITTGKLPPFEEIIKAVKEQSAENYRDMQQFTFALAHDLKNSLTKLKLALSLLKDEEIPPVIDNYIQIIHRAADRLETITMSLNKMIQLGDSSPDVVKKISPGTIWADVQEEFAESLVKKEAQIKADFSLLPELNYIEIHLKSIFSNLLSNSIKYSSPYRPIRLSISAYRQDGKAVFVFSDNGQGIDLAACGDKLFLPFTRFSVQPEGSGIGLYLVKNMVERNGGKIEVESVPGEGTSFRLLLHEYDLPVTE